MITKITNWTIGSFFRTIGRVVAYALIGLLIYLFASGKVSAMKLTNYHTDYVFTLPSNCNSYIYYRAYLYPDNQYLVCSSSFNNYAYILDNNSYNNWHFYFNRYIISQSTYNDYIYYLNYGGTNPITLGGVAVYDNINNIYYGLYGENTNLFYYSPVFHQDYIATFVSSNNHNGGIGLANNIDLYINDIRQNISYVNLAGRGLQSFNVTFHLNSGVLYTNSNTGIGDIPIPYCLTDCTKTFIDENELSSLINNLRVEKNGLLFEGWYYDYQFQNVYLETNALSGNIDLYANFNILNVEDIVQDINFNEYTFDTNYRYAVISATTDFNKGIYLGFQYDFPSISVFNYRVGDSQFDLQAYQRLSSLGIYSNIYYYHMGSIVLDNVKLIILSKDQLTGVDSNGVLQDYYTFYVSDNASVTFTSDLTNITFDNTNGDSISANASDTYFYNQNFIINNESDLITIFRSMGFGTNNIIFNTFSSLWIKFKGTPLYNYFFLLCLGSLIIFIIKVASRK